MKQLIKTYSRKTITQLKRLPIGRPKTLPGRSFTLTAGGTRIIIRPVRLEDSFALYAMHQRLSRSSLYFRYLRFHRPTLQEMERVTHLKVQDAGFALVAQVEGEAGCLAGLAYFVKAHSANLPAAEPAIIIEDRFQGLGLGKTMFDRLCRMARSQGIAILHATIHPDNHGMRSIVERLGFPVFQHPGKESIDADIVLQAQDGLGWLTGLESAFSPTR